MTAVKIARVSAIAVAFLITAIVGMLNAAEPATRPTSGPSQTALADATSKDAVFAAAAAKAYAVIVIPKVSPTGTEPGEGEGKGEVLIGGKSVGRAMEQSVGVGATGDQSTYAEIVLVEDEKTLDLISNTGLQFDQNVSATMLTADGKTPAVYKQGIAVFFKNDGDARTDRSVAGQTIVVRLDPK